MRKLIDILLALLGLDNDIDRIMKPMTRMTDKLERARQNELDKSLGCQVKARRLEAEANDRRERASRAAALAGNMKKVLEG